MINTNKLVIALFASALSVHASLINYQSGAVASALQSDGVTTLSSAGANQFRFALGTFDESVLSGSSINWSTGFTDQMLSENQWLLSPPPVANTFQGDVSMASGAATGQTAYIFGKSADDTQVVVFKNPAWVFPAYDPLDLTADIFSLTTAGTEVVNTSGTFVPYSGSFTMVAAVPEPSSFALLAGCFGLAWVMVRRRA